ncbi:uncharacterized protein [Phyllobates terribilis]|uniref:uncharacterized protein n=1 Tax=Phyllobates terribilis TaxID=111132 RepID=UPI003CCB2853
MLRLKREPGLKQLTAPVREMIACRALSIISDCKYCKYSSSRSKVQVLVKILVSSEIIAALVPEENCLETAAIGWREMVANFFLAFEVQLSIIPIVNQIDLKNADPERVEKQIEKMFDVPASDCIRVRCAPDQNHSCRQI